MVRQGFGIAEVVVALIVFTIGALGAAALTAHAARLATGAARYEAVVRQTSALLDSLAGGLTASVGAARDRNAVYAWTVRADSAGWSIEVVARLHASGDTIRLTAVRPPLLPQLQTSP